MYNWAERDNDAEKRAMSKEDLIAENEQLRADLDRRNGKRHDCRVCGNKVPWTGAVFCSEKCWYQDVTKERMV